jgi:hypothetical protein
MFVIEMFDTAIKELLIREGCAVFSSLHGYDVTFAMTSQHIWPQFKVIDRAFLTVGSGK